MTRAEGIFGVWDLRSGSLSSVGLTGRRAAEPPMDDGRCGVGAADLGDCRVLLVEAGGSTDEVSRLRFEGVDVDAVLGRGGGAMGDCCARDGVRVDGPAAAPTTVAVVRGRVGFMAVVVVAAGVFGPPD